MTAISWCPGAPRARPRGRTSPASTRRPRGCVVIPARRTETRQHVPRRLHVGRGARPTPRGVGTSPPRGFVYEIVQVRPTVRRYYTSVIDNAFPRRGFAVEDFMLRFIACSIATLTLALAPVALHAQEDERPVSDRYTVPAAFGGLSGPDRLNGAGAPDWRQGWAGSVDGTYWLGQKLGPPPGSTLATAPPPLPAPRRSDDHSTPP